MNLLVIGKKYGLLLEWCPVPSGYEPVENGAEDEMPADRVRKCTKKAQSERMTRLKADQTTKRSAATKKRSALTNLMADEINLHLVKTELGTLNRLFQEYQEVYKQLAAAVTLSQPEEPKFNGNPIEYKTFIVAFATRI